MIFDDETDPKTKRAKARVLDKLSVDELAAYIADMKAEIERVEAEIVKREKHKAAMAGLFRS